MIKKEMNKILKSPSVITTLLLDIIVILVCILKNSGKENLFQFYFDVNNDVFFYLSYYIVLICVIVSETISSENKKCCLKFAIKRKKYGFLKIFSGKIISTASISISLFLGNFLFVLLYGILTKKISPYEIYGDGKTTIIDNTVFSSFVRLILFNVNLIFGIAISLMLAVLVAVFFSNRVSAGIIMFIFILSAIYPIKIQDQVFSISGYKLPIINLECPIELYCGYTLSNIIMYFMILMILCCILIVIGGIKYEL